MASESQHGGGFPPRPGLSRRDFLHGGMLAAAGFTLGPGGLLQPVASLANASARASAGALRRPATRPFAALPAQHADVLRIGLIGCGGRGTGAALQCLLTEPGTVVLVAMADAFQDRIDSSLDALRGELAETADARLQVPPDRQFTGFDAAAKLIASDVDLVLLTTPPHFRPAYLAAAIAANKHVFCEKPMAVDAPGIRSVLETVALAKAKQRALVAGFCWRYNQRHRELYARVQDGAIGDIRAVYSTYNSSPIGTHARQPGWSDMEWQLRNWHTFTWLSGDHITEQACHSLDKQAWAFGDVPPLSVVAVGGNAARDYPERGDAFDHFGVTFDYPNEAKAFHMCRQIPNCANENNDWIWGTKGDARIEGWTPLHVISGANAWEYEGEGNDMYQTEHDELVASIRAGTPINDGEWMARSSMLAIMARLAATTGQRLTWEQALASTERLGPVTYEFGPLPVGPTPVPGRTPFV